MNEVNIKVKNLNLEIPLLQSNRIFEKRNKYIKEFYSRNNSVRNVRETANNEQTNMFTI